MTSFIPPSRQVAGVLRAPERRGNAIVGDYHGLEVRYLEPDGVSTFVVVLAGKLHDVLLEIYRQDGAARRRIANGTQIDVTVGDPRLDRMFVIEGAPSDIVIEALDARTRRWLCKNPACTLRLKDGAQVICQLGRNPIPDIAEAIDVITSFAVGLPDAVHRATRTRDTPVLIGDAYRPGHDLEAARQRQARARWEVLQLRWLQEDRTSWVPVALLLCASLVLAAIFTLVHAL